MHQSLASSSSFLRARFSHHLVLNMEEEKEHKKIAWINIIETNFGKILAACDKELLGKTLKRGDIEITVSKSFYGGELVDERRLVYTMLDADVLNLIGNEVVRIAKELGLISEDAIIFFDDEESKKIPHAQMYRFYL